MARKVMVLEKALAIMETVGASAALRQKFREQVEGIYAASNIREVDDIQVASVFSQQRRVGVVELIVNDQNIQMEPKKAQEIGLMLLEAAEAAISDAVFIQFIERIGITEPQTQGQMLMQLREIRQGTRDTVHPH